MSDTDIDFAAVVANPYYAITFAPHVFELRDNLGPAEDWVIVNSSVITDIGAQHWLEELLDYLSLLPENFDGHDIINPTLVVTISDTFSGEHEPLITRSQWAQVNNKLMNEIGAEAWLWKLLEVLKADSAQ